MGLDVIVHADAVVADGDEDVFTGFEGAIAGAGLVVNGDVAGLDGELAAAGHGVAGIDDEVHDDLLDLAGIGVDIAERGIVGGGEFDVLADEAAQHFIHAGDDFVQLNDAGLEDLLAAEGEQLAGERGGAAGGFLDLLDMLLRSSSGWTCLLLAEGEPVQP